MSFKHKFALRHSSILLDIVTEQVDNFDDFCTNMLSVIKQKNVSADEANKMKGDVFEVFVEEFLTVFGADPSIQINEYSPNNGVDQGVDGHGVDNNNDTITVQCKFKSNPMDKVSYVDDHLANFIVQSALVFHVDVHNTPYHMVLIASSYYTNFNNDEKHIKFIGRDSISSKVGLNNTRAKTSNVVFWNNFRNKIKSVVDLPAPTSIGGTPKQLRRQQQYAISQMQKNNKGIILHPTGTGKSLIQSTFIRQCIEDKTYGDTGIFILVSPIILLGNQLLNELVTEFGNHGIMLDEYHRLLVNSDKSASCSNEYELCKTYGNRYREVKTSTDKYEIAQHIRTAYRSKQPIIISSTYDSLERIKEALEEQESMASVILFDEAHHLTKRDNEKWTNDTTSMPVDKTFFFTATLHTTEVTDKTDVLDMENENRFGQILSEYKNKSAVLDGEIVRPAVHGIFFDEMTENDERGDISCVIQGYPYHNNCIEHTSQGKLAGKLLISCASIDVVKNIMKDLNVINMVRDNGIKIFAICSDYYVVDFESVGNKTTAMDAFRSLGPTEKVIVLHCDMLTEGIDVPGITGVMPLRNLKERKFLQTLGRATRLYPEDRELIYAGALNPETDVNKMFKQRAWVLLPVFNSETTDRSAFVKGVLRGLRSYDFRPSEIIWNNEYRGVEQIDMDELQKEIKERREKVLKDAIHDLDEEIRNEQEDRIVQACQDEFKQFKRSGQSLFEYTVDTIDKERFRQYVIEHEVLRKRKRKDGEFVSSSIPFTPIALIREIFSKIDLENPKKICVLYTIEMAIELVGRGFKDVTLGTWEFDKELNKLCEEYRIKYVSDKMELQKMKFDVVIGNPPYQDRQNENTKNIWPDFIRLSLTCLNDDGIVALVTPRTWTTTSLYSEIFTKHNILHLNIDECEKHFPGVGSTFSYFVIEKHEPRGNPITIVNRKDTFSISRLPDSGLGNPDPLSLSILNKMLSHQKKFKMITSSGYNTMKFSKKDTTVSKEESASHPYKILHKTKHGKDEFFFSSLLDPKLYNVPRVIINIWVANYNKMVVSDTRLTCEQYRHFPVDTIEKAENLKNILLSPLYTFLAQSLVSGGSHTNASLSQFPQIDLSRAWTNEDLYKYFELTDDEIEHVLKEVH